MKMKRIIILLAIAFAAQIAHAQTETPAAALPSDLTVQADSAINRRKPTLKRNRIDREINKNQFSFKGETMLGITASYGTISSEDTDIGLILDDIKLKGSVVTVKPFVGYMYRDNNCIGLRFGYTHMMGNLGNATLDLGEANDIEVSVGNMRYKNNAYAIGIYHRTYVAIDSKGRFGVFGEFELSGSVGRMEFSYLSDDTWKTSLSDIYKCEFSFNPGLAVYIFPNVCATISFGLGGLRYTHTKQYDGDHNFTGKRNFSKMRFRLNIADINFGMTLHLWNKKKDGPIRSK